MRILGIANGGGPNVHYRALVPLSEMHVRGHKVDQLTTVPRADSIDGLRGWDVVHLRQLRSRETPALIEACKRAGLAVTWDTDDDISSAPLGITEFSGVFARRNRRRTFEAMVRIGRAADVVTATNPHLAEVYRSHGVERVHVVENYLAREDVRRVRRRHAGVVIGIVGFGEHEPDLNQMQIGPMLQRVLQAHEGVRVVVIGPKLDLGGARFTYHVRVPIERLLDYESSFDIALAPLRDTPFNRARSDVKLKEYAAAGATWLASPVGPYQGLGEQQGGRLVEDDEWFDAIDALLRNPRRRIEMQKKAATWVRGQSIERGGARWEAAFESALRNRRVAAA